MSMQLMPPNGGDDDITRELRALYAPPADVAYWDGLEARILRHLREPALEWWTVLNGWARLGAAAAVIAALAAGLLAARARTEQSQVAWQSLVDEPTVVSLELDSRGSAEPGPPRLDNLPY
ncbi:MAG TPA: hypothetical protein VFY16_06310 [Gemmatimonadaceae bacterium]|nr:hypothetical protein [Gemmatimonadaceae bacterium]